MTSALGNSSAKSLRHTVSPIKIMCQSPRGIYTSPIYLFTQLALLNVPPSVAILEIHLPVPVPISSTFCGGGLADYPKGELKGDCVRT